MKQVPEMPTSGQFVAVWIFNDEVWSEVYINQGTYMDVYSASDDEWYAIPITQAINHFNKYSAQYFIADYR